MKILVAGATGVAGGGVVPALVAAGHQVSASVRSPSKAEQVRAWGAEPLELDLFDPASVAGGVRSHDAVCNFSTHIPSFARAALPGAWSENDRLRRQVSANLANAALQSDCGLLLQESIAFLYADRGDEWIDEDSEVSPTAVTQSALEAEENVARFVEQGRVGIVLRFGQFYGPSSQYSIESVRIASRLGIGPLLGDPDGYSSWIHQDDLGPAVVAALGAPSGTYNVGDDEPMRRRQLHAVIAEALGRKPLREGRQAGGAPEWA